MAREDVSFQTTDNVTLRGWFYRPRDGPSDKKLPCLVMAHGWSAVKEMDLDAFAEHFTSKLSLSALVYDNRGFGASDTAPNAPPFEIIPSLQRSDYSDAITYAQSRADVDAGKIGIWGSSYSGGHVLTVGATDRRVKAVLSQVPLVDGWANFGSLIRSDVVPQMDAMFTAGTLRPLDNRLGRMKGERPATLPVTDPDPTKPSALPTADSWDFFSAWDKKGGSWKNEVTLRSIEELRGNAASAMIHLISPTPLLMTVAEGDVLTPAAFALEAYGRAREPKQLHILPGGHFDAYSGPNFEKNAGRQTEFLRETLCNGTDASLPNRNT